jgi:uncharacterized protein
VAEPRDPAKPPTATRLADARSAYLRSAAGQSIDWHPWGEEAFALARRTGRPILLDIGASWCHWCHVMDETTYADAEVARLLRSHFVAVKVDRDEHPEVDRRYQRQVGAIAGEGGWPLTGFLTPDGETFLGGTFFPPTDGHGRPGFRRVLQEVARIWREEPERIRQNAEGIQQALQRMRGARAGAGPTLEAFLARVRSDLASSYDPANGGFGGAPKFPHPTAVSFLLWDAFTTGDRTADDRARETLLKMADGGMYDQVGGGFHRYSVDDAWHIPHFEKMGIDNAALLGAYVEGFQRFGEARFEEVVRGIVEWSRSELGDPAGGWGASQDADNAPGDDGSYFTWTRAEMRAALDPEQFRLATRFFGVDTEARMPHDPDRSVLFRLVPLSDAAEGLSLPRGPAATLAAAVEKLRAARARRPAPAVDQALYAEINGRFIGAFARAGAMLGEPSIVEEARRAADRWISVAVDPKRGIAHRIDPAGAAGFGLLDDQVSFAGGLLELAVALAEPEYLRHATDLLSIVDREFRGEDGLFRDLAPQLYDGPAVAGMEAPSYPLEDSPHLSANAAASIAFARLGALVHDDRWADKARALLPPIVARVGGAGLFVAGSALAAGLLQMPPTTVVIEGTGAKSSALLRAARRIYHPRAFVFGGWPPAPFSTPEGLAPGGSSAGARALVCRGTSCAPPVTEPEELSQLLRDGARA